MTDLPDLQRQQQEWEAWQVVVAEWRRLFPDVDMNEKRCDGLIRAVEVWGEALVALRLTQDASVITRAKADKTDAYSGATAER